MNIDDYVCSGVEVPFDSDDSDSDYSDDRDKNLPRLESLPPTSDSHRKPDNDAMATYNATVEEKANLLTAEWIQVSVKSLKTGAEVVCKLISPTTTIRELKSELFSTSHEEPGNQKACVSILRVVDEKSYSRTKKKNSSVSRSLRVVSTAVHAGAALKARNSKIQRKSGAPMSSRKSSAASALSSCHPSVSDDASLQLAWERSPEGIAFFRSHKHRHQEKKPQAELVASVELSERRQRVLSSSAPLLAGPILMRALPGASRKGGPASHGAKAKKKTGEESRDRHGAEGETHAAPHFRRKLFLLWECSTLDDDHENALIFVKRALAGSGGASGQADDSGSKDESSPRSGRPRTLDSIGMEALPAASSAAAGSVVEGSEAAAVEPLCPYPDASAAAAAAVAEEEEEEEEGDDEGGQHQPKEGPDGRYEEEEGGVDRLAALALERSVKSCDDVDDSSSSSGGGRGGGSAVSLTPSKSLDSMARVRLSASPQWGSGGPGFGGGGGGPAQSQQRARPVLATWKPSGSRELMKLEAALSSLDGNDSFMEARRLAKLEEDMERWDGLSLFNGRVHKLHLSASQPPLQGPTVLGPELGLMSELQCINFSHNRISASFSLCAESLGSLTQLRQLSLADNAIAGSLTNVSVLKHLTGLDLSKNALTGAVPKEMGALEHLVTLGLSRNKLTGKLPHELGKLTEVIHLDLSHNSLEGSLGSWVGMMRGLQRLNVAHNKIVDTLPAGLDRLDKLEYLHVSFNRLDGDMPMDVLTGLNVGIREILLQGNGFYSAASASSAAGQKAARKATAILADEAERVNEEVMNKLMAHKVELEDIYPHCTICF